MDPPVSGVKARVSCGWKWAVLFSCFLTKSLNTGLRKSFGVLLLPLQDHFNQDVWLLGMMVSISVSVGDFTGPIVGGLSKRLGCRVVVMTGGIFLCFGLVFASLATNIIQLAVFLCVVVGLGFGFVNDVPFAVLGRYFEANFSLANGFAMTGTSFGLMLLGPLTAFLIDVYGWRGTLLFLGAIAFHITSLGAILIDPNKLSIRRDKKNVTDYEPIEVKKQEATLEKYCNFIIQSFDITLFKEPKFISIIVVTTIIRFIQMAWLIYLVPNVISKGVSNLSASFISTTAGVGAGIGQLLPGIITSVADKYPSSRTIWTIGMAIISVSLALDGLVDSYAGMLILGACQGIGLGITYATNNVVLFDEFGKDRLVNSMGYVRGFSGFGRVLGGILPGWIYQMTSSYHWSYVILGIIQALAIVILHIGRIFLHCSCCTCKES
ncbi:monocarboxylate transporter 13-like [Amphiura filiformis]|uniref:monocarboxylate transporter 13-like n=1 Tax=Amphiura filiformis TaxID=82378 RepID=UPI003B2216EC